MASQDSGTRLGDISRFLTAIKALLEVAAVALLGQLCAMAVLIWLGWDARADLLADRDAVLLLVAGNALFTMLLILALQGAQGRGLHHLGWTRRGWRLEALLGVATLPLLVLLVVSTTVLFHLLLPGWASEDNPLLELIRTRWDLFWFVLSGIFVGGVQEEIQRAFILDRFERHLGGAALGLALWSAGFGALHAVQGWDRAFQAALLGLVFGLIYLWRRNLTAPMVSHALYDVVVVVLAYSYPEAT